MFYHEHVLTKDPGTSKETPWHHDQSYYPVDGQNLVSLWIPVDAVELVRTIICLLIMTDWLNLNHLGECPEIRARFAQVEHLVHTKKFWLLQRIWNWMLGKKVVFLKDCSN